MKITELLRDPDAIKDGVWVRPVAKSPEFVVKARIRSEAYQQDLRALQQEWAGIFGATPAPRSIVGPALAKLIFDHCIVEFRGMEATPDFPDVSRDAVQRFCGTDVGEPMLNAFSHAADLAEARRAADAKIAEGNSEQSSNGS